MVSAVDVEELPDLSARQVYDVLELRNSVAAASRTSPLSDHVVSVVKGVTPSRHFVQTQGSDVVGYANLDDASDPVAELLVGAAGDVAGLLDAVTTAAGRSIRIWTRGDAAPLNDVLTGLGFKAVRTLLQLRRPLDAEIAAPAWPEGVSARTFTVGVDEAAWLDVNNAAFASHPDQAGWTLDDIKAREDEAWFDPAGFFLAESGGRIVGFHWTKVHAKPTGDLGEVYVIGVHPSMQGKRLGEALLLRGLHHLQSLGLSTALLYVDADNTGAIRLYERHGFARWDADRCLARRAL